MIIKIDVTNIQSEPRTTTTNGIASGSNVNTNVVNTNGFAASDFILIGNLGDEATELQVVSSITDTDTFVITGVALAHPSGTPIRKALWDQIKLERSADNSSWSVISTINIKGDQTLIEYNDTAGASTDYYRYRYYNSTTATYDGYSNSFSAASAPSPVDIIISDVIRELGTDYDDIVTKPVIFSALADVDLKIARTLEKTNKEIFKTSYSTNLVSGTTEYPLPSTLVTVTRVLVGYESSARLVTSVEIPLEYGEPEASFTQPYHSIYRKASDGLLYLVLRISPYQNVTNGLLVEYERLPSRIYSTTSTLLTPNAMLHVDTLKNGIKEIIYRDYKDNLQKAQVYGQQFSNGLYDILATSNTVDKGDGAGYVSDNLAYVFIQL